MKVIAHLDTPQTGSEQPVEVAAKSKLDRRSPAAAVERGRLHLGTEGVIERMSEVDEPVYVTESMVGCWETR